MKYNRGTALWVFIALLALALAQVARATTYYTYDNLGRVTQVVESDGTTTQYSYDANGNVTAINRIAGTTVLSIGSVSSATGAAGSSVTITGSGFSSIPGQDVVTFNGVAATVTYASGNRLVVTVPAGAGTGDISITTQAGSATSSDAFTVVPISITSFSPASGVGVTGLTINGGGFDPTPANDTVLINGIAATVVSATTTQLQVAVPSTATPGHISVSAPLGSAVSAGDFFVPASGYTLGQISQIVALVPGGDGQVYPINPPATTAVVLFDGTAGQRITIAATNLGIYGDYQVYAPDGSQLVPNSALDNSTGITLPALTQSGTYAFYFTPASTPSSATFTVQTDVVGNLPTDGTPTPTSLAPSQNATYTFNGIAGQTYSLTLMPLTTPGSSGAGVVFPTIYNPDGSVLIGCSFFQYPYNNTNYCDFTVATTGTYTVRLTPDYYFGAYSFGTYVVQDFSATLVPGTPGPAVGETLVPEQHGLMNFTAAANQTFALYIGNVAVTPTNDYINLEVSGPTGFVSQNHILNSGNGPVYTYNLPNLAAGNYLVTTTPHYNGDAISLQAVLANGVTGMLTTNGTAMPVQTYVPGQNAYLTFNGTQGQNLALALSQLSMTPASINSVTVSLTGPNGSPYTLGTCYTSSTPGCSLSLGSLPQTGTYAVTVEPEGLATMNVAVSVPPDVTGSLTLNNPTTVNLSSQGQQGVLTFAATANEAVILSVSSIATMPANAGVTFYVYNPGGTLVYQFSATASDTLNLGNLAAGTYTIDVVPNNAATGSMSVNMQPGASAALTLDGTVFGLGTVTASQNAYLTFNATAGQSVDISLMNLQFTPSTVTSATMTLYNPTNGYVWSSSCYAGAGCVPNYRGLPATGTYSITITPSSPATMTFSAAASLNLTDTITPNTPYNLKLNEIGQYAMLSFTASAGQSFAVQIGNVTTTPANTPVSVQVYNNSDYSQVGNSTTTTTGSTINLPNLAAATYVVWIGPQSPATTSAQIILTAPDTTAVPTDGSANSITTSSPGQNAYVTFNATAGQSISASLTNLVLSPASAGNVNWSITAPDRSSLMNSTSCPVAGGCDTAFITVPLTGTYTINVMPTGQQTMSFTANVNQNQTGTIASGTAETLTLNQLGQAAALAFTVTAVENLTVGITGVTTSPANTTYWMGVYTPSGGFVNGTGVNSGGFLRLNGLSAGNYILWIVPETPATGTMQLAFQQDVNVALPTDGSSNSIVTTAGGESAYATFQATAGQSVSVTLSNLSMSPSSGNVNWTVTSPTGSTVLSPGNCYPGSLTNCTGGILAIPTTGTYTINMTPSGQQTLSAAVTIAQNPTGTIGSGINQTLDLSELGQCARFEFTVASGQPLSAAILTGISTSPTNTAIWMGVYTTSGSYVTGAGTTSGETVSLSGLGAGNYYLWIGPETAATGSMQLSFQ